MIFCMTGLAVGGGYGGHSKIGGMISQPIVRNHPIEAAARHPPSAKLGLPVMMASVYRWRAGAPSRAR